MTVKQDISVVWLKRDLRLHDNEAIHNAVQSGHKVLFMYVFEDTLIADAHYSERHWGFVKGSLYDINEELKKVGTEVLTVRGDVISVFQELQNHFNVKSVFSHQETGLMVTFERDKRFKQYCISNNIQWIENINNGVFRGLTNREGWFEKWENYMYQPQIPFDFPKDGFIQSPLISGLLKYFVLEDLVTKNADFQAGGSAIGIRYMHSFFDSRHKQYMFNISKPEPARSSCSRLSPYIAWGNISVRTIFQLAKSAKKDSRDKRHLSAFISRLRWQAHFIQKFEMECSMETQSVNKGYHKLNKPINENHIQAWERGETGFPLVDAAMRCLVTTGYLNFRMRAMLVSFFTHILWQPWQKATHHLARNFLDFEPGIHFPQLQMQAGETGINNLRIYNPYKNAMDHDPDAVFIKKWVPEIAHLPKPFIHEPHLMTPLDQQFNGCVLGSHYPHPIVDIKHNRKKASDILWEMKDQTDVLKESRRILKKHTLSNRNRMLRDE